MSLFFRKKSIRKKNQLSVRKGDDQELQFKLLNLLRKRFNLQAQLKVGQLKEKHMLKNIRHEIARIKFYLK